MTHASVKMPLNVFKTPPHKTKQSASLICSPEKSGGGIWDLVSFHAYQRTKSANSQQRNIFINTLPPLPPNKSFRQWLIEQLTPCATRGPSKK